MYTTAQMTMVREERDHWRDKAVALEADNTRLGKQFDMLRSLCEMRKELCEMENERRTP